MKYIRRVKRIIKKTFAIAEKNILTSLRFKYRVMISYLTPIISMLMPLIIFNKFFEFNSQFGPWTSQNYLVFIFIGYNTLILRKIIGQVPSNLLNEKYWKTLPALLIAPFNRYYLLFGYIISEVFLSLIPFMVFLIITFILYPVSFLVLIIILCLFLGISIIFSGIGLLLGVLAISNENLWSLSSFFISLIFWISCVSYPFEFFPKSVQNIVNLNPIYYLIDIIRLFWVENDILLTILLHPTHMLIYILSIIIIPIIGVFTFNIIFKKSGITGY